MSSIQLNFMPHPLAGQVQPLSAPDGTSLNVILPPDTQYAVTRKYSFLLIREPELGGWFTSWQDRYGGGSASSTREGPFRDRFAAEANCRRILKELGQKN